MFCFIDGDEERSGRWKQSRLSYLQWKVIKEEADALGITFLASCFEYETVKWLSGLGVCATKVASRAANRIECFEGAPLPLMVSNGMYDTVDIKLKDEQTILLECESVYPSIMRWGGKLPGYSDHSGNPWRAIDAISRGCKLIEVHFHIDRIHAGPDLPASLALSELGLVCEARDVIGAL